MNTSNFYANVLTQILEHIRNPQYDHAQFVIPDKVFGFRNMNIFTRKNISTQTGYTRNYPYIKSTHSKLIETTYTQGKPKDYDFSLTEINPTWSGFCRKDNVWSVSALRNPNFSQFQFLGTFLSATRTSVPHPFTRF